MNWINRLQQRWKVTSVFQVVVILVVFACTGFTVLFLKRPLFRYLFEAGNIPWWATLTYYVLILPVYNVILLFYGFIFGQFRFFWNFERRLLTRLSGRGSGDDSNIDNQKLTK